MRVSNILQHMIFPGNVLRIFLRLILLTVLINVASEIVDGLWRAHTGDLFNRYFIVPPVQSIFVPLSLWVALSVLALWELFVHRQMRLRLLGVVFVLSTVQNFSNHKLLLCIVLFFLCLDESEPGECVHSPGHTLICQQTYIVYLMAVMHKISTGFYDGTSLKNLFWNLRTQGHTSWIVERIQLIIDGPWSVTLSTLVIAVQLALPFSLQRFPRVGLLTLVVFHVGMALCMPGLWTFTSLMLALGYLLANATGSLAKHS